MNHDYFILEYTVEDRTHRKAFPSNVNGTTMALAVASAVDQKGTKLKILPVKISGEVTYFDHDSVFVHEYENKPEQP